MLSKKIASSLMSLIAIFALVFVASSAKAVGFEVPIPNETRIPKDGYLVIAKDISGSGVRDNPVEVTGWPNLETFLGNGGIVDVVAPEKVIISEIMWGSDASLSPSSNSQWIELKNKSGKSLLTGDGNYKLVFYIAGVTPPAKGADGSLPSGVTDRVGTITDEGVYWSIAGKGQSGRTESGDGADPTVPIISMYRVADAAGKPRNGQMASSWMQSTPPAVNFILSSVNRIGSPGADRLITATEPEATTATARTAAARAAAAAARAAVARAAVARNRLKHCGLGWAPQSQYPPQLEQPKVMIYALEFEFNQNRYTCSAIEIRTGDATISHLDGWQLYLGTLYNPSRIPIKLTQENSQITDNVLRLTPDLLGQQTFACSNVNMLGFPLPSVHYVLKNANGVIVDRAYSCYIFGQSTYTQVNGEWVESQRRISGQALQSMDIPRIERYITNETGIYITYIPFEKFGWDRVVLSDWLLASSEETEVAGGNAPSSPYKKLATSWAALKKPGILRRNEKRR